MVTQDPGYREYPVVWVSWNLLPPLPHKPHVVECWLYVFDLAKGKNKAIDVIVRPDIIVRPNLSAKQWSAVQVYSIITLLLLFIIPLLTLIVTYSSAMERLRSKYMEGCLSGQQQCFAGINFKVGHRWADCLHWLCPFCLFPVQPEDVVVMWTLSWIDVIIKSLLLTLTNVPVKIYIYSSYCPLMGIVWLWDKFCSDMRVFPFINPLGIWWYDMTS